MALLQYPQSYQTTTTTTTRQRRQQQSSNPIPIPIPIPISNLNLNLNQNQQVVQQQQQHNHLQSQQSQQQQPQQRRSIVYNFDMSKIADDAVVVAIGRRGSGKTTVITDLLYHKRHFQWGVVMTGTEANTEHYKQFIPELFIYDGFRQDILDALITSTKSKT